MAFTQADKKFLKQNFATKDDLKVLAKQKDLLHVQTKVSSVERKLDELTEFIVPAIGNLLEWTDDIHRAIVGKPAKRAH